MNPTYRIAIPLALAAVAAAANFVLLKRATATAAVLVLTRDVAAGEVLKDADFAPAKVRADPAVFQAAYPAAGLTELIGSRLRREAKKGELVIRSDVDVDGQDWELRAGERDGRLLVRVTELPDGLSANSPIEFVVPGDASGLPLVLGPYRFLAVRHEPPEDRREAYARVSFAGTDLGLLDEVRAAHPDELRLARLVTLRRVAAAPPRSGRTAAVHPRPGQ